MLHLRRNGESMIFTKRIKVGDVVAWKHVPKGALVRDFCDRSGHAYLRCGGYGDTVHNPAWPAPFEATIVALGLTGQESAADLRRLAEVFEVREALVGLTLPVALFAWQCRDALNATRPCGTTICGVVPANWARSEMWHMKHCGNCRSEVAECLHAAGWQPGMTAEDAARLLRGRT